MTSPLPVLVVALDYPSPDSIAILRTAMEGLDPSPVRTEVSRFVEEIEGLELGEWEELHTRTLDLSPLFVPYVGHLAWGESYRRGAFMAELQRAQLDAGVDQRGELPDHIVPILGYLDRVDDLLPDLTEVLASAVSTMRKDLKKTEPDNPYRHLLAAVASAVDARLAEGAIA